MGERVIMSREILFKAKKKNWRTLSKEEWWMEGDLIQKAFNGTERMWISESCDKERLRHVHKYETEWRAIEVDPDTICQFTGLHDETRWEELTELEKELFLSGWNYKEDRKNEVEDWNGKKIWENDIVKCPKRKEGYELYQVVWRNEFADFGVEPIKSKYGAKYPIGLSDNTRLYGYDYRALGNIFDNPELLEERFK